MTALDLFGWSPTAEFSPCTVHAHGCPEACEHRPYRYRLTRRWGDGPAMLVVGLNPSTATAVLDDQTIRVCVGYARREGLDGLTMANLLAFRARAPKVMKAAADPIGPENDAWLSRLASEHPLRVAAWGVHGEHLGRATDVLERGLLGNLHCLARTKDGHPGHPLYLPTASPLTPWP